MEIFHVFLFLFGGNTGCGPASLKLCACDAASPWSQSTSPDSQCLGEAKWRNERISGPVEENGSKTSILGICSSNWEEVWASTGN